MKTLQIILLLLLWVALCLALYVLIKCIVELYISKRDNKTKLLTESVFLIHALSRTRGLSINDMNMCISAIADLCYAAGGIKMMTAVLNQLEDDFENTYTQE